MGIDAVAGGAARGGGRAGGVMTAVKTLGGAAIGVMCTQGFHDILDAIRSCGGHPILLDQFGIVRGATMPLAGAALVLDVSHPRCEQAIDTAAAARMPVVAFAFGAPTDERHALLKARNIDFITDPDAKTVCRVLLATIARGALSHPGP
jgi:NAD(P)H-dependent flavin oxidoreductase YrpB (nitropropane dioxygenase family)